MLLEDVVAAVTPVGADRGVVAELYPDRPLSPPLFTADTL
jgi:hypothetical protein